MYINHNSLTGVYVVEDIVCIKSFEREMFCGYTKHNIWKL